MIELSLRSSDRTDFVDITGQVCADSLGHRIYSGIGGQADFIRGAALAPQGKPIIALRSTAKDGAISRIVDTLIEGSGVVTTLARFKPAILGISLALCTREAGVKSSVEIIARMAPALRIWRVMARVSKPSTPIIPWSMR